MTNTEELLKNFTEDEKKAFLEIMNEMSSEGVSTSLDSLVAEDYNEIPVDIETFLHNPNYLGKALYDNEGRFTLFPYWEDLLKKIYPNPLQPAACNTLALTGAIGIGKSTEAVVIGLYELYRMMCLKDPYVYYGIMNVDVISFAVVNITLDAAHGVAWSKMQNFLQLSPWFMAHGMLSKSETPEWKPKASSKIELIVGSVPRHFIGRALFWVFLDEISFTGTSRDVEKQKAIASELVNEAAARMQSRFMRGEYNPTIMTLASSKRTDQSFLETWISNKKKIDSKTTWVVDEPQWVIRTDKDSTRKFKIAIGNEFLQSEVLSTDITDEEVTNFIDRGYRILDVPIGYYENFLTDIDIALNEIAGISTTGSSSYISGVRLSQTKTDKVQNLFIRDIIEVGDAKDDQAQYYDFIDLTRLDPAMKGKPLFIGLDLSLSGDKSGIVGTWIKGKNSSSGDEKSFNELYYQVAFNVSVKAPKGHQVSFEKTRNFIYWLKKQGFNIKGITSDTYARAGVEQDLLSKGYNYSILSVDRVGANKVQEQYAYLKNCIYEQRILIPKNGTNLLTEELIGLKRDNYSGRVDHSPEGINCFTGDTKVSLVDGREVEFKQLVDEFNLGKTNWVYSFNHKENKIEPKRIKKAWCSGHNAKLIEVTLDNGEVIRCTPEHKFMLRNGEYIEAKDMINDDSLMPLYRKYDDGRMKGYRLYYEPIENHWHFEHRRFAVEIDDEHYLVHHKNCVKSDNTPDNLIWMSKKRHVEVHAELQTGAQRKEAKAKRSTSVKKSHYKDRDNKEYWIRFHPGVSADEAYEEHMKHIQEAEIKENRISDLENVLCIDDYYSLSTSEKRSAITTYNNYLRGYDISGEKNRQIEQKRKDAQEFFNVDYNQLDEHTRRSLSIQYAREADPTYQECVNLAISNNHKLGKYKNAEKALNECNQKSKMLKKLFPIVDKDEFFKLFDIVYDEIPSTKRAPWVNRYRQKKYDLVNHKVVSVRYIDDREDVYDIEIEDNHNFALSAGVFVHNSKDSADALCQSVWNASQHSDEYSYEYGESLKDLVEFNELLGLEQQDSFEQSLIATHTPKNIGNNASGLDYGSFGISKPEDISGDIFIL